MITKDHLKILISVLKENCIDGKVITRSVLFSEFENKAQSEMEPYRFKKALSFLIENGTISGYGIKRGRSGGIFKIEPSERISISCSSGKFIGEISLKELSKLLSSLKETKRCQNGNTPNRSRSQD